MPLASVPFFERQVLRWARARSGRELPTATICYVWGRHETRQQALDNPYSRRVRYLVLRNALDPIGQWCRESRDLGQDFLRLFADESTTVPPLTALYIGADGDNTGMQSSGYVAALELLP